MDKYKDNESNVWALIYDQCSPELAKNKLKKQKGMKGQKVSMVYVRQASIQELAQRILVRGKI
jgi:glycerol dehydrogenase-like iron-containing ADH family enzyme